MENVKDLEISEMIEISGGLNPAYEIGYALGTCMRRIFIIESFLRFY
jgi:hypothetical protein